MSVSESETSNLVYYFQGEPELSRRLGKIAFQNQLKFYSLPPWQRPRKPSLAILFDDPDGTVDANIDLTIDRFEQAYERSLKMLPAFNQAMIDFESDELRYRTLSVCFAGQAFHRDHARFPKTLDELVPGYLESIPVDTYDNKPLKYRFDPTGPVVYSIFENLTDENGIEWSKENMDQGKRRPDDLGSQMRLPEAKPPRNGTAPAVR